MSRCAVAAIAVLGVLGCGHPPATQSPPLGNGSGAPAATNDAGAPTAPLALEDDLPRLATRAVELYRGLQHVIETSPDCASATTALDAIATSYADVIAANARILHAGHDKIQALRNAIAPHEADIDAAAKAISVAPLMPNCAADPGFAKAMDRLIGEPS